MTAADLRFPLCGAVAADCFCSLPPHGDSQAHECHAPGCGGVWRGHYPSACFTVVRFPSMGETPE